LWDRIAEYTSAKQGGFTMGKIFKRITAATMAGVIASSLAVMASAATNTYKCDECGRTTTSTLSVTSTTATATTSIDDGKRGVSVSISGTYITASGVEKNTGNGKSSTAGVTVSIGNSGGKWTRVTSTHSKCCDFEDNTILNWYAT